MSRDFRPFFCLKDSLREIFRFRRNIQKAGVRVVNDFFLGYGDFHILRLLLLDVLTHLITFVWLIVPLKSVRNLQSFPKVSA